MKAVEKIQKVTVNLPVDLLKKARQQSGKGITETVKLGLQLVAAREAYQGLLKMKGKYPHMMDYEDLKRLRE